MRRSLVDQLGGIDAAIALVKEKADIPAGDEVTLLEESMDAPSIQAILSGAGVTRAEVLRLVLTDPSFIVATLAFTVLPLVLQVCAAGSGWPAASSTVLSVRVKHM